MEAYIEITPGSGSELYGEVSAGWVVAVGGAQLADWQAIGDDRIDPGQVAQLLALVRSRLAEARDST
jgi:hypothetical protein